MNTQQFWDRLRRNDLPQQDDNLGQVLDIAVAAGHVEAVTCLTQSGLVAPSTHTVHVAVKYRRETILPILLDCAEYMPRLPLATVQLAWQRRMSCVLESDKTCFNPEDVDAVIADNNDEFLSFILSVHHISPTQHGFLAGMLSGNERVVQLLSPIKHFDNELVEEATKVGRADLVQLCLERREGKEDYCSALIVAAKQHFRECFDLLLPHVAKTLKLMTDAAKAGADWLVREFSTSNFPQTEVYKVLLTAVYHNRPSVVRLLLSSFDVKPDDRLLQVATEWGHKDIVWLLLHDKRLDPRAALTLYCHQQKNNETVNEANVHACIAMMVEEIIHQRLPTPRLPRPVSMLPPKPRSPNQRMSASFPSCLRQAKIALGYSTPAPPLHVDTGLEHELTLLTSAMDVVRENRQPVNDDDLLLPVLLRGVLMQDTNLRQRVFAKTVQQIFDE